MATASASCSALKRCRRVATASFFSTHEPNQAFRYATKVLALKDGRVLAFGLPGQVLTPELLQTLYGVPVAVTQVQAGSRVFSVCTPYVTDD